MDIRTSFGGYLKAADFPQPMTLMISHVTQEEVGQNETKPVVHFHGLDKSLVLNKTNANAISVLCGSYETDQWAGKQIVLHKQMVDFQGRMVEAIRVQTGYQTPAQQPQTPAMAPQAPAPSYTPPAPAPGPVGPTPPVPTSTDMAPSNTPAQPGGGDFEDCIPFAPEWR